MVADNLSNESAAFAPQAARRERIQIGDFAHFVRLLCVRIAPILGVGVALQDSGSRGPALKTTT
jgi:hypothetical protein